MSELYVVWAFVGLMALNLMASFLYLVGLNQMKATARKAYQSYTTTAKGFARD